MQAESDSLELVWSFSSETIVMTTPGLDARRVRGLGVHMQVRNLSLGQERPTNG